MTTHITARIAWHQDGWNGHICHNPASNVYCIGQHSYPGDMIAERRNLAFEKNHAGQRCTTSLGDIPPCVYSINAFGDQEIPAFSDPPDFFRGEAERQTWTMSPATVAVWPYEVMYQDELRRSGNSYDYDKRLQNAKDYFAEIEEGRSLIFYYANYSNPLNQEDERRYAIVGLSRIKKVADIRFYDQATDRIRQSYGGGFIWQCDITSHYPDEGLRLPYHVYKDDPEKLARIAMFPDNPRLCKYGTRHVSDDNALDLVERFVETAGALQEMGDESEDWSLRLKWLQSLIAELWHSRGLYPGMGQILDVVGFHDAIPYWKSQVEKGQEKETREALFAFLDGQTKSLPGLKIAEATGKKVIRQWKLRTEEERTLLRDVLPRFDILRDQIERILPEDRVKNNIHASLPEILENPYILSEQYEGDSVDDVISFNKIDHGVFPSPQLGGEALAEVDDSRRLRALCVEQLRRETKHTFVAADKLLRDLNHRMEYFPEWKSHQFTERYFEVDEEELKPALVFREGGGRRYVYLRTVYEAERAVEKQIRDLVSRPNIKFKFPVTEEHWRSYLTDANSVLNEKAPNEYAEAIDSQVSVCSESFSRPLTVLCGAAGTGKTTAIRAIIKSIEKAHGTGTSVQLLAPTGKAADRIRAATGKPASTVHAFLMKLGWLNPNMTFKRSGGKRDDATQTFIIDEASMLNLELAATFFRAVNWSTVQRLILVGDPNQLPPIGRGKVFAEIIEWLKSGHPESYAELQVNVRQMENRVTGQGEGILKLAQLYMRSGLDDEDEEENKLATEEMLKRIQEGGDVDQDLRAIYWNNPEELADQLIAQAVKDMERDTRLEFDEAAPHNLWSEACKDRDSQEKYPPQRTEYLQIITPYRGELYGTEALNIAFQRHLHGIDATENRDINRSLGGIMLFDKVMQTRNRPKSNPIHAYNFNSRAVEAVEVFNGELGFVAPHSFDSKKQGESNTPKWKSKYFRLKHFQVRFSRKEHLAVGYGTKLGRHPDGGWIPSENVEDNLELAYAISTHKSQGSEFDRVYFIVPKHKATLMSPELFYTGLTRAKRHCTLLIEEDIGPLLSMRRRERSHLLRINSSLLEFKPLPDKLVELGDWYEEGKIYDTLAGFMVRSKSEVIIANMLNDRDISFKYEEPLFADDGTFYLPDFTIRWNGEDWYWEHWGLLDQQEYRERTEAKKEWYNKFYPGHLVETFEGPDISTKAETLIQRVFA